ncbi:hypothetical protein NST04_24600 [Paenibacillus sp. FSL H7-0756]|uniref:hypothetical protein n=1 Tax=Paenibacillus sp. FSL H7-0756 TaxID=2954738 RepID=UPI0030F691CA
MTEQIVVNGVHCHSLCDCSMDFERQPKIWILGSVLCDKERADLNEERLIKSCQKIKEASPTAKIYVQQPYYLFGQESQFIEFVGEMGRYKLIDGIVVNGPGILNAFQGTDHLEFVLGRFSIRKRKRTNAYLFDLLKNCNIAAVECFAEDTSLLEDLSVSTHFPLWIREGEKRMFSLSRQCLIQKDGRSATCDPRRCASGSQILADRSKHVRLISSGHLLYRAGSIVEDKPLPLHEAIIYNAGGLEI